MKKLFQKDEVLFAVLWIVVYVIGFSVADGVSESIGIPKLVTVFFGLGLSLLLLLFIGKNNLTGYFGLCRFGGNWKTCLFFIPLAVISSVNLWNGLTCNGSALVAVLGVISMCLVGFLEEIIFRGFLFRGMCKSNVKTAILVSSLTFGVGHIVNLLLGAPLFDTLLQLVYATGVGFCYTAVFYVGGSLLPCMLSHAVVNSFSIFAVEPTREMQLFIAIFQTIISVGYGLWLLQSGKYALKK